MENQNSMKSEGSKLIANHTRKIESDSHIKIEYSEMDIVAFDVNKKDNVIAYCTVNSNIIQIVRWSPGSGVVSSICGLESTFALILVEGDVSCNALAFSEDGLYLAVIGNYPEHMISIFDWKLQKLLTRTSNTEPAKYISFNPLDSKELCTSGISGNIAFWKLKVEFKKYTLQCTK